MRYFIWLIILGALYWAVRELAGSGSREKRGPGGGEEMVPDPQCGVYVPLSRALRRRVGGVDHYFCSRECEDAFTRKNGAD